TSGNGCGAGGRQGRRPQSLASRGLIQRVPGNGTPELCGVGHRCDSQFFWYVEMWHSVAGLVTLKGHSLSDLDLNWTKSRLSVEVESRHGRFRQGEGYAVYQALRLIFVARTRMSNG